MPRSSSSFPSRARGRTNAWLPVIGALGLAGVGLLLRQGFSIPFLYGTWLGEGIRSLAGDPASPAPGVTLWAWLALAGAAAALWVRGVTRMEPTPGWRTVRVAAHTLGPALVIAGTPLFVLPLTTLGAFWVSAAALSALACFGRDLRRQSRPTRPGVLASARGAALCALALVAFDWVNLLLIGGS